MISCTVNHKEIAMGSTIKLDTIASKATQSGQTDHDWITAWLITHIGWCFNNVGKQRSWRVITCDHIKSAWYCTKDQRRTTITTF